MSGHGERYAVCARVVLIGFMGSGKSTVGRRLASLLDWDFVDFDEEIERRTGKSVPEIFRDEGEAAFRSLEAEITDDLAGLEGVVLAPGGGWITQPELLEELGPGTLAVWLRVTPEEAARRTARDEARRPLLAGPDSMERVRRLMERREPLYQLADEVVDVDGREPGEIAREIAMMMQGWA